MNARIFLYDIGCAGAFVLLSAGQLAAQHPLDSWVRRTVPGPNTTLQCIAFGNGVFVAVGDASAVARSTNGADWTVSTAGGFGNLKRIRFLNGQFVVVGSSDQIISSADGLSWASITAPQAGSSDVAFGNGVYVLVGAKTYASTNGVDWTQTHPMNTRPFGFAPYETALTTVLYGNGRFVALTVGEFAPATLTARYSVYSTNGIDWLQGGIGPAGDAELVYADGILLGTSGGSLFNDTSGVMVSTNDGASWCCPFRTFPNSAGGALAFGEGHSLWIENFPALGCFSSTNGFSWGRRYQETNIQAVGTGAAFGYGTFVVGGVDGTGAAYILQSGNLGGAPSIVQEPEDRAAVVDNPASFSVQAAGTPPLAYQWRKGSNAIANATNNSYSIAQVGTGDVGGYQVIITNSFGSVTSRVAQLTVAFLGIDCYAGIKILGVTGRTYRIEATPASGTPNWQTITNLVLPANPYTWIDFESPTLPARLYRAAELP